MTGTISSSIQKVLDFGKTLKWKVGSTDDEINLMTIQGVGMVVEEEPIVPLISNYTTKPTFDAFAKDVAALYPRSPFSNDTSLKNIITNGPFDTSITAFSPGSFYSIYKYIFGEDSSPKPPSDPSPCRTKTTSIPGGYVETRCFDS